MNTATWIVSGLLAAMFAVAGIRKSTQPVAKLRGSMGWVDDVSLGTLRLIGASELLAAIGLIVPKLTDVVDDRSGVQGTLSGLAATGLVAIMVLAIPVHLRRGETSLIPVNVLVALLAAFVAAARFGWL